MGRKILYCVLTVFVISVLVWSAMVRPAEREQNAISLSGGIRVYAASEGAITGTPSVTSGAATGTPTPAVTEPPATPTPNPAVVGIDMANTFVKYETEEIEVAVNKEGTQIYYAVIKAANVSGVKQAELIPAAEDAYGKKYYIDISNLSASKENFIGITTTLTPGADGLVPVSSVTVHANQKKITFNVDWAYEGTPKSFDGKRVLESVVINTNDSKVLTYKHITGAETELIKDIDLPSFQIQWRKGANGEWKALTDMTYTDWTGMKNSGAIIYFRMDANNQTSKDEGQRYSKENKIKVAITKAPSIKVDVSKLTLSIKNGMQFRKNGSTAWYTVLPYYTNSTVKDGIRDKSLATLFDPFTENTVAKIAAMSITDVKKVLGYVEPASPTALILDVRIAATTKKPASRVGTVTIPYQAGKPNVTAITKSGEQYTIGTITAGDTLIASPAFEYCIVYKSDFDGGLIDYATLKWSTIKSGTNLKSNVKGIYNLTDAAKTRKTCLITDPNACILIRRRGLAGSSKSEAILASADWSAAIPDK